MLSACLPGMTHWQSPNFFAYFPANTSFPGILAEMLIGTFNMIGFSWQSAPVATELEHVSHAVLCYSLNSCFVAICIRLLYRKHLLCCCYVALLWLQLCLARCT